MKLPDGRTITGYGGILYNIFGLSRLLGDRAEILPICNLGADVCDPVQRLLNTLNNVNPIGIHRVDSKNNHCIMTYKASGERNEIFEGFVPAISIRQLESTRDCNIAMINFISGRDLTLRTLKRFRADFNGKIYLDFHTLSLGLHRGGERFFRKPARWKEYIECCDILQMNRAEFGLLSGCRAPDRQHLTSFFEDRMAGGNRVMIVTLGERGASMVRKVEMRPKVDFLTGAIPDEIVDTTGAGDVFSAGFCYGLSLGKSLIDCLKIAVEASVSACRVKHPEDLRFSIGD